MLHCHSQRRKTAVTFIRLYINTDQRSKPINYLRRALGATLGFSPFLLLLVSLVFGFVRGQHSSVAAVAFMTGAVAIAGVNFYLSFVRPRLYRFRHDSMDGYRFVSGVPIIGSVLTIMGAIFGFGAIGLAILGIIAFALDTGGSGWFVIATWRDHSLWDA